MNPPDTAAPSTASPKVSRRSSALVNFAFSHANTLLVIVQGILLVPFYLSHIPTALYGAWLATGNILSWIELVDPGLSSVLTQRVATTFGAGDLRHLGRVIGTGLMLSIALSAMPLLALPLAGSLGDIVHLAPEHHRTLAWSFRAGLAGTAITLASYATTAVLVGLQQTFYSGTVYTSAAVVGILSTVLFLTQGVGLASIPLGLVARSAVLFLGTGWLVARWCARHLPERPSFDRAELHGISGASVYTFVARIGVTLAARMDAFLTANLMSPVDTAVLSLTGRPLDVTRMMAGSVGSSLQSGLAHLLGEGGRQRAAEVVEKAGRAVSVWTVATAGTIVALNHALIPLWVRPSDFGGTTLTALLACAAGLSAFSGTLNQFVFAAGGIRQSSFTGLAEALLKVALQVLLVRRYGLLGMPLAAIAASLALPAWMLPRIVARLLGASPARTLGFWAAQGARLVTFVAAGALLSRTLRESFPRWTWPGFMVAATVLGALALGLSIGSDRVARRLLLDALATSAARLRGRA